MIRRPISERPECVGGALQVVEAVDLGDRRADGSTAAMTSEAPTRPSLPIPPAAEVTTQRIRPSFDRVGEPRRADLALAAGEAAEGGDVGARGDERAGGAGLAGDGDRAAAVGLGVLDRGGERRRVAAEGAAPAGPPRPARPPTPVVAGPPAGNVPLVGVARGLEGPRGGREQQRGDRRRSRPRAAPRRPSASAASSDGGADPGGDEHGGSQARSVVLRSTSHSVATPASTNAGRARARSCRRAGSAPTPAPTSAAIIGASWET